MTFQFLPNYCKKIGLFIFVAAGVPSMYTGFMDGFMGRPYGYSLNNFKDFILLGVPITEPVYDMLATVGVIGLLIYLFSKDKMMDEFLTKLRLEAVQLTFIVTALFMFVMMAFNSGFKVSALNLIEYQVVLFLFINMVKKLNALPKNEPVS